MPTSAEQPIMPGFYPDPTICRVGPDYYLAHSSFEYFPGAPIFHSTDLLTWQQVGHILTRRTQFRLGNAGPSSGIYGSTLRHHDDRFWFVTTNVSDFASGQLIVHAEDPAGPWSDPVFVRDAIGIDPDLCWDSAGQCYLTWKALPRTGEPGIRQGRLDLTTGELASAPYPIWQGTGLAAPEAPHLYQIGEYWYLMLAEGGTERGHCVTVARGRAPEGPFEPCPGNPIFTHRSAVHPVQNTGHADLVRTADGEWAAVYLGVRPRGSTPLFHVLGRETFLAGIDWVGGWPVFDEARYDVPVTATAFTDDFSAPLLGPRWVVPGGEPENVAVKLPAGGLELRAPGLLCARVRDLAWSAEATFGGSGQFLLRLDDRHWCGLIYADGQVRATAQIGSIAHDLSSAAVPTAAVPTAAVPTAVVSAAAVPAGTVVLRIQSAQPSSSPVPGNNAGPDELVLSFDTGDGFRELGRLDGRYFSTEVAGGFTGRMLAIAAGASRARVLAVTYLPT